MTDVLDALIAGAASAFASAVERGDFAMAESLIELALAVARAQEALR